jgi:hypothetical protein
LDLLCKDINEALVAHSPKVFNHLLEKRITINVNGKQSDFFLSSESNEKKKYVFLVSFTPQNQRINGRL